MSNELQRLSDNILELVHFTRGTTLNNGEVHNDIHTNNALAQFSFTSGTQNVSGMKAFNILKIEGTKNKEGKFTLDAVVTPPNQQIYSIPASEYQLEIDDVYSLEFNGNYEDCGKITSIEGNVVTVDSMYLDPTIINEIPSKAYFSIMDKPFAGTTEPMGTGAQATGYKNKAGKLGAFVTGYNNVAGGKYSFVSGNSNRAGVYSSVSGCNNAGTGHATLVSGMNNKVSGWYNYTCGRNNIIKGNDNIVGGMNNTIYSGFGTAFVSGYGNKIGSTEQPESNINGIFITGYNNTSIAEYTAVVGRDNSVENRSKNSFISGSGNIVKGPDTIVSGQQNTVSASQSFVTGLRNKADGYSISVSGTENNINASNTCVNGILNEVYADSSAVFGGSHKVLGGTYGAVFGGGNTYNASYGFTFGQSNILKGNFAFAGGTQNSVHGAYALAQGWNNFLYGNNSFSFGSGNTVGTKDDSGNPETRHDTVFLAGQSLKSWSSTQTVFGRYNNPVWSLFHIGNGTSDSARSNAFIVNYNGTAELPSIVDNNIGTSVNSITTKGYVDSAIDGLIQIGTDTPEAAGATAKIYIQITE